MRYRRTKAQGGYYFFTVNLADRQSGLLTQKIEELRTVFSAVKKSHPFAIIAMTVMPEHLHTLWRLPENDHDYPLRWSLIKAGFSRLQRCSEQISNSRQHKRERVIWQRRYWEHLIRDENDLARHIDYIHYNPVKHGLVDNPMEWPHSTLHRYIEKGILPSNWGKNVIEDGCFGER